jgi:hypothetical protein
MPRADLTRDSQAIAWNVVRVDVDSRGAVTWSFYVSESYRRDARMSSCRLFLFEFDNPKLNAVWQNYLPAKVASGNFAP